MAKPIPQPALGTFVHVYHTNAINTYDLRLIAENQCRRDTQTISLLVMPNDIEAHVTVNGNQLEGCAPHTVTFNNSSTGASILTWYFGDKMPEIKTPNTQNTVTYTYAQPGNYTVRITLSNGCTDTIIYRTVTVYKSPKAGFNTVSLVCTGNNVFPENSATNATAYEWFWDDGQTSSGPAPFHAYQQGRQIHYYARLPKN